MEAFVWHVVDERARPAELAVEAAHQPRASPAERSARGTPFLGRPLLVVVAAPQESPWHCVRMVWRFEAGVLDRERHLVPLLGQTLLLPVALRVSL
eukprot:tig00000317_g24040.t1